METGLTTITLSSPWSKTFNLGSFGLLIPSDGLLDNTKACIIGYPGELGNGKGNTGVLCSRW